MRAPVMTLRFECSICGKDPILCNHIAGQIYDGRLALNVAKDIKFDHLSIVDEPRQIQTYILPRPLTAEMLTNILPAKLADDVIALRRPLTCNDIRKAINRHGLAGGNWKRH